MALELSFEPREAVFAGRRGEKHLLVRRIEAGDIGAVLALQQRVSEAMPEPSQLALIDREDLLETIELDFGLCLLDGNEIVAYTQMVANRSCEGNHGEHFGFPAEKCVVFDTTFVNPAYRGLGIQQFCIRERERAAVLLGAEWGFVTVSPQNAPSLNNLLAQGFEVHMRGEFYGGRDRYLMKKKLEVGAGRDVGGSDQRTLSSGLLPKGHCPFGNLA
ncbi:MAG: hypothetical protein IJ466_02620 [Clostridia bacterium]|nr:hypothetical protein [Clostridia bacterium]